jgi:glutaminase
LIGWAGTADCSKAKNVVSADGSVDDAAGDVTTQVSIQSILKVLTDGVGDSGSGRSPSFGIAVVSPPLDEAGNSVRAQKAITDISNALAGIPYVSRPSARS